ncbi:hypothetical protein ACFQ0M_00465 [Kitasatospora aburaviensis]
MRGQRGDGVGDRLDQAGERMPLIGVCSIAATFPSCVLGDLPGSSRCSPPSWRPPSPPAGLPPSCRPDERDRPARARPRPSA